jgi:hypothetical protein
MRGEGEQSRVQSVNGADASQCGAERGSAWSDDERRQRKREICLEKGEGMRSAPRTRACRGELAASRSKRALLLLPLSMRPLLTCVGWIVRSAFGCRILGGETLEARLLARSASDRSSDLQHGLTSRYKSKRSKQSPATQAAGACCPLALHPCAAPSAAVAIESSHG